MKRYIITMKQTKKPKRVQYVVRRTMSTAIYSSGKIATTNNICSVIRNVIAALIVNPHLRPFFVAARHEKHKDIMKPTRIPKKISANTTCCP